MVMISRPQKQSPGKRAELWGKFASECPYSGFTGPAGRLSTQGEEITYLASFRPPQRLEKRMQ
jgi:hypothetical protein